MMRLFLVSSEKTDDMPLQVTDYAELVSRPGDFATLRQKNRDGMYTALEQFEVRFLNNFTVLISIHDLSSLHNAIAERCLHGVPESDNDEQPGHRAFQRG